MLRVDLGFCMKTSSDGHHGTLDPCADPKSRSSFGPCDLHHRSSVSQNSGLLYFWFLLQGLGVLVDFKLRFIKNSLGPRRVYVLQPFNKYPYILLNIMCLQGVRTVAHIGVPNSQGP